MRTNKKAVGIAAILAAAVLTAGLPLPASRTIFPPAVITAQAMEDAPYTLVSVGSLDFAKYEDHAAVVGCKPDATDVEIPETVEGVPVTYIDMYAFQGSSVTSVTFPKTIKSIGHYAFGMCTGLTSFTIPDSVEFIGIKAFQDCTNLKTVEFPDHLVATSTLTFDNTPWLTEQRQKNPLVIVNGALIDGEAAEGDVVVPSSVKYVAAGAFTRNPNITSVVLPASVTAINDDAFFMCDKLTSVEAKGAESIGIMSFAYCDKLTDVKLSGKLTKIDTYAFSDISSPGTITFYGTEDAWKKVEILDTSDYLKNSKIIFDPSHQEPADEVIGDVNGDGELTSADAVALQKWILAVPGASLKKPEAGDLDGNGILDVFDLGLLKRELLKKA